MFFLTIVNKTRRHCHSWLTGKYLYTLYALNKGIGDFPWGYLGLLFRYFVFNLGISIHSRKSFKVIVSIENLEWALMFYWIY